MPRDGKKVTLVNLRQSAKLDPVRSQIYRRLLCQNSITPQWFELGLVGCKLSRHYQRTSLRVKSVASILHLIDPSHRLVLLHITHNLGTRQHCR